MALRRVALLTALTLALAAPAPGDAIQLKASVRLPSGANVVRLADIAVLEGPEAGRYAELVIAEPDGSGALIEIPIDRVRAALDEAGAHWGRINLSGRKVIVRPRRSAAVSAPGAMAAVALGESPDRTEPGQTRTEDWPAERILDEPTLRGELARRLQRDLSAKPPDLRFLFDRSDEAWLDRSTLEARFELRPESSPRSDRVTFTVCLWRDGRVAESRQITVRPLLRVKAAVLSRDIGRGEVIAGQDLRAVEQWMSPLAAALCTDPARAAGSAAARSLNAGDVLRRQHVQPRVLIQRGDRVNVRCLVGGVVISLTAEARTDGAEGETIGFRKLGERREFTATVTGRGEAVIDLQRSRPINDQR